MTTPDDLLNSVVRICAEKADRGRHPCSVSLVELLHIHVMPLDVIKSHLNALVKERKLNFYKGLNQIYFVPNEPPVV